MIRTVIGRGAQPLIRHTAFRGLATKATSNAQPVNPRDPDPHTPVSKMLDRLADAAFMTELFRGVSIV